MTKYDTAKEVKYIVSKAQEDAAMAKILMAMALISGSLTVLKETKSRNLDSLEETFKAFQMAYEGLRSVQVEKPTKKFQWKFWR